MSSPQLRRAVLWPLLFWPAILSGQDTFGPSEIRGLKLLDTAAIVVAFDTTGTGLSYKDLGDMLTVALARNAPTVTLVGPDSTSNWITLSIIHVDGAATLEVSVIRYVTVLDTRQQLAAKVWWDERLHAGAFGRRRVQEAIDDMLTRFGADLVRARH